MDMFSYAADIARMSLRSLGCMPTTVVVKTENEAHILVGMFDNDTEKAAFFHTVKVYLACKKAREYLFISEAWYVKTDLTPATLGCPPSEHPDRQEGIVVFYVAETSKQMRNYDIVRVGDDVSLGESNQPQGGSVGGVATEFLGYHPTNEERQMVYKMHVQYPSI